MKQNYVFLITIGNQLPFGNQLPLGNQNVKKHEKK